MSSPVIKPLALIFGTKALTTKPPTIASRTVVPMTGLPQERWLDCLRNDGTGNQIVNTSHWNDNFNHRTAKTSSQNSGSNCGHRLPSPLVEEVEPLRVFVKCFTKFLKVKHFTSIYKGFVNGKYFTTLATFYMQANT